MCLDPHRIVIPGRAKREPGISRFPDVHCTSEVWSFGPSRNDETYNMRHLPGRREAVSSKIGIIDMFVRIASLVLSVCAFALPASAADYPDHAIKMIVPFAAGGGTDVLARIIAQNLNSKWGQPVVVENQPG